MNILFISVLTITLFILLGWGIRHLPKERWQFLAAIPLYKKKNGLWRGVNFTYYGFFIASSQLLSMMLLLSLLGSIDIDLKGILLVITLLLLFCIPAARLMAIIVEKKRHTFTVGGASFVGIILAPWIIIATNFLLTESGSKALLPAVPFLAAISIAYTLGEGFGRLACLSYGCCYGKPVAESSPFMQEVFKSANHIFYGENKKVAYEAGLCGTPLIPIQAMTAILYCLGALIGTFLFLQTYFTSALLLTISLTQIWRVISETMRADFRGFSTISAYQKMGLMAVLYVFVVALILPVSNTIHPEIIAGIKTLWNPIVIIFLQLLWGIFFYTFGRSSITTSTLHFGLVQKNI